MRISAGSKLFASATFADFSTPDHGGSELSAQGWPATGDQAICDLKYARARKLDSL